MTKIRPRGSSVESESDVRVRDRRDIAGILPRVESRGRVVDKIMSNSDRAGASTSNREREKRV